jgi:membrane-associated protease RseP (regulator of RpoE activity)
MLPDSGAGEEKKDLARAQHGESEEEPKPVTFSWGIVMVRTKRLLNLFDDLARYRIFSDLGWLYLAITMAAGAFMVWLMLDETYLLLNGSLALRCAIGAAPAARCQANNFIPGSRPGITSYLLLPGINQYIPVLYGIIGIIVAVVVHEGTHGVIARRLKLPVKSTGLLFFLFVPIGAFVEMDEGLVQKLRARDSGRILAGGPGSNVVVGLAALALMILLLGGLAPAYSGVLVTQYSASSPASEMHAEGILQAGDVITAVNGTQVYSQQGLADFMSGTRPNETLMISIGQQGETHTYPVTLGANPDNGSIGFIGITVASQSLSSIGETYASAYIHDPLLYLVVPGLMPQAEIVVPFSGTLHSDYSSAVLGGSWYPVALTLFWIFFINMNLAFFNSIPLYPLDGGQALLGWLSHSGRRWVEARAKLLTTFCSILMLALILVSLLLPTILSFVQY